MTRIVVTDEQAKLLNATEEVQICDPRGHILAIIPPELTPDEFAKLRRAKDCTGPWLTGGQVRETLQALEDAWQKEGPFGEERMREIVQEIRKVRVASGSCKDLVKRQRPHGSDGVVVPDRCDVLQAGPIPERHQSEGLYRICDPPLVAYYEIAQDTRRIEVTNVLAYRPPIA